MIRFLDIFISFWALVTLCPLLALVCIVAWLDTGSPVFRQVRMGKDKKPFVLYKFRTMPIDTLSMASHLIPESQVTVVGGFLRKYKLDEILQFYNVMTGDMSVVGPRPNLFNQGSVCDARDALGVYCVRPGITGWSQLRMIDMSYPMPLAETDADMISNLNIYVYFKCIFRTAIGRGFGDAN